LSQLFVHNTKVAFSAHASYGNQCATIAAQYQIRSFNGIENAIVIAGQVIVVLNDVIPSLCGQTDGYPVD